MAAKASDAAVRELIKTEAAANSAKTARLKQLRLMNYEK